MADSYGLDGLSTVLAQLIWETAAAAVHARF